MKKNLNNLITLEIITLFGYNIHTKNNADRKDGNVPM